MYASEFHYTSDREVNFIILVSLDASTDVTAENDVEVENNLESFDQKAAPWWEQQEEAAKRRCQSSCTMHSRGVKAPQITLCDDTDVSSPHFFSSPKIEY